MNRDAWIKKLDETEKSLGFSQGYKFVYGPWATLQGKEFAFLSLNPGRAPNNADMRTISDERGNSYEVERHITRSPITKQFWQEPLSQPQMKTIIACSDEATNLATEITDATFTRDALANWGNYKIRRYDSKEKTIIHLPHLSRFQLMGRPDSEAAIRSLMGG